ncbi:MAG: 50S ribosomal protein L11 methyltransferase [Rickettsiales bacterium]
MDIILEAGHAFGSGGHPSTQLVLHILEGLSEHTTLAKVLDIGCGSGVLSIAAVSLLDANVLATDISPDAVLQTEKNAALNGMADSIRAFRSDGPDAPEITKAAPYDLILCNVLTDTMIPWLKNLNKLLKVNGLICFSGILSWQEETFRHFCLAAHFEIIHAANYDGWSAILAQNTSTST